RCQRTSVSGLKTTAASSKEGTALEPDEDQGICRAQPQPRRRGSLQDNKLLAEKCHLGFASRMRSEHSDEKPAEKLQKIDHPDDESNRSSHIRQPGYDFGSHSRYYRKHQRYGQYPPHADSRSWRIQLTNWPLLTRLRNSLNTRRPGGGCHQPTFVGRKFKV